MVSCRYGRSRTHHVKAGKSWLGRIRSRRDLEDHAATCVTGTGAALARGAKDIAARVENYAALRMISVGNIEVVQRGKLPAAGLLL